MDLIDISHHQNITKWADVPKVPIVHKVNEGTFVDYRFESRMKTISTRTEIFGGYTVLIRSRSSIRQQIEKYYQLMYPFWRDGAFTQMDVEPWPGYSETVDADDVVEACEIHDELFGNGRCCIYINFNQEGMREVYDDLNRHGEMQRRGHWMPDYRDRDGHSGRGARAAETAGAFIHQFTSRYEAAGFSSGIDGNVVRDWDHLNKIANRKENLPMPSEPDNDYDIPSPTDRPEILWRDPRFEETWLLGVGGAERVTPKLFAFHRDRGVPLIEEIDSLAVRCYVAQSGMQMEDLTKVR